MTAVVVLFCHDHSNLYIYLIYSREEWKAQRQRNLRRERESEFKGDEREGVAPFATWKCSTDLGVYRTKDAPQRQEDGNNVVVQDEDSSVIVV